MPTTRAARCRAFSQRRLAGGDRRATRPVRFPPGSAWQYSKRQHHVLGAILEEASGQIAGRTWRRHGCSRRSGCARWPSTAAQIVSGCVSGYGFGDGGPPTLQNAPGLDIEQAGAASAMRGTADDLCRFGTRPLLGRAC